MLQWRHGDNMKRYISIILAILLIALPCYSFHILNKAKSLNVFRGTITGLRISAVDGTAFIDNAGATIPTYADGNHSIEIYDPLNRMLKGVLKEAGIEETAGADLVSGWDFTSGWTNNGWTVIDANSFSTAGIGGGYKAGIFTTNLALYKVVIAAQDNCVPQLGTSPRTAFDANSTSYRTKPVANDDSLYLRNSAAGTTDVTQLEVYQVTAPSSSGATIVSAKAGEVYNFAYKNASFTYDAASYFVIVRKIR
jgi:hypothetical protein